MLRPPSASAAIIASIIASRPRRDPGVRVPPRPENHPERRNPGSLSDLRRTAPLASRWRGSAFCLSVEVEVTRALSGGWQVMPVPLMLRVGGPPASAPPPRWFCCAMLRCWLAAYAFNCSYKIVGKISHLQRRHEGSLSRNCDMHVVYMTEHSERHRRPTRHRINAVNRGSRAFKTFAYPAPRGTRRPPPGGAGAPHINPDPNSTRSSSSCFQWMFSFSYNVA